MTPALQALFDVSTRIREYEAASDALKVLARLATDVQVRAGLQQQAEELAHTAGQWRQRQDAELAKVPQARLAAAYAKHICLHSAQSWSKGPDGTYCDDCKALVQQ